MSTSNEVRVDYTALQQIATVFAGEAQLAQTLHRQLSNQVAQLRSGGWQSQGANVFYGEMEQTLLPALKRLISALENAGRTTGSIADLMAEAERDAARLFSGLALAGEAMRMSATLGGEGVMTAMWTEMLTPPHLSSGLLKGLAFNLNPTLLKSYEALHKAFPKLIKYYPGRYTFVARTPNLLKGQATLASLMDMASGRKGLPVLRFDLPHKGAQFAHINIAKEAQIGRLKGVDHVPISSTTLKSASGAAKVLHGIGKAAPWVAAAVDVYRLGDALQSDGWRVGANTIQTGGSVIGGWGGAFVGAKAGALGGAAIGTLICPGVGTAVGTFIGGLGGGIIGGISGSSLGRWVGSLFT